MFSEFSSDTREVGLFLSCFLAFWAGVVVTIAVDEYLMPDVRQSCRDDRNVEQLCIDGNANACRVMEARQRREGDL